MGFIAYWNFQINHHHHHEQFKAEVKLSKQKTGKKGSLVKNLRSDLGY